MKKRFRCGRLILTRDGLTKKIDLGNGGGTRFCDSYDNYMTFKDVHHRLLHIFNLDNRKHKTSLYDFQFRRINVQQYNTFSDYMNKYGLNRNSTVVYLCTREDDADDNDTPGEVSIENANAFTSPIESQDVVKIEPHISRRQSNQSSIEYSFINSSNDLMKNARELLRQNGFDEILIQLFEYICIIHGYVSSIIVPLQQSNPSDVPHYLNTLNNVYEIFESTKILLRLNMNQFARIQLYSTIRSSFFQFHNNVQILRNRWSKNDEKRIHTTRSITKSTSIVSNDRPEVNRRKSPPPTTSQKPSDDKSSLFQSILHYLHNLSRARRLSSHHEFLSSSVREIKVLQSNINLIHEPSICDAKKLILSIKEEFKKRFNEEDIVPAKSEYDRKLYESCKNTLRTIRFLLTSLNRYQIKICGKNRQNGSN